MRTRVQTIGPKRRSEAARSSAARLLMRWVIPGSATTLVEGPLLLPDLAMGYGFSKPPSSIGMARWVTSQTKLLWAASGLECDAYGYRQICRRT